MKYIIGKNKAGMLLPLVFDAHIRHKDVAKIALKDCAVISAGIACIDGVKIICCGESRSLNTKPCPGDEIVLMNLLFLRNHP